MMPKIPAQFCKQTIQLRKIKKETDQWNQPVYEEPTTIEHVIVQPQTIYSGTNNNRQVTANAVIYFFTGVSSPLCKLTSEHVGSIVTFEERDFVIKTIIDNRDPYSDALYSYELEVL